MTTCPYCGAPARTDTWITIGFECWSRLNRLTKKWFRSPKCIDRANPHSFDGYPTINGHPAYIDDNFDVGRD